MAEYDPEHASGRQLKVGHTLFEIVEHIADEGEVGVTELSKMMDLPKSTVHAYLKTLEETTYVLNENGKYRLSYKLLELGGNIRNRTPLYRVAKEHVNKLARKTNEVAVLGIEEQNRAVLLYAAEGENAVWDNHPVGDRTPMHVTALGKAILAHLPDHEIEKFVEEQELSRVTEESIVKREALMEDLQKTRERGYSIQRDEHETGISAFGVPIKQSPDGKVIGSLAVAGPSKRFADESTESEIAGELIQTANIIEIKYENRVK